MKTVLVLGSGGREHALAWALSESEAVEQVEVLPGNPRMEAAKISCRRIAATDTKAIIERAQEVDAAYVVVGPELPLSLGLVDDLKAAGILAIGPTQAAAQLETSKHFAKQIMQEAGVPTAKYTYVTDLGEGEAALVGQSYPVVIKDDGLKAGKGVTIAQNEAEAKEALTAIFAEEDGRALVEEYLEGPEFSVFTLVGEGDALIPLGVAQDHKRAYEGGEGPNTGGMGAFSPIPNFSSEVVADAYEEVVQPVVRQMSQAGTPFRGFLYSGLMQTSAGLRVIEFNVRLGDPETQVVLKQLATDLDACLTASLQGEPIETNFQPGYSLGIVCAAEGYPMAYEKGMPLGDLADTSQVQVFAAGVKGAPTGGYLANGGRLYMPVAHADTLAAARAEVLAYLSQQPTAGCFYRQDIGEEKKPSKS